MRIMENGMENEMEAGPVEGDFRRCAEACAIGIRHGGTSYCGCICINRKYPPYTPGFYMDLLSGVLDYKPM